MLLPAQTVSSVDEITFQSYGRPTDEKSCSDCAELAYIHIRLAVMDVRLL